MSPIASRKTLALMLITASGTTLNLASASSAMDVILERSIVVAQCRLGCLSASSLTRDSNAKLLCLEDSVCGSCWTDCFLTRSPPPTTEEGVEGPPETGGQDETDEGTEVVMTYDPTITDTSVRVNRCTVMWHFEGIHPPRRRVEDEEEKAKSPKSRRERALLQTSPPAVIYQVYGKDVAGKWFDLNQWTLPSISLPEHVIAKTEQVRIVGVSVHGTNGGRWTQTDVDVSRNSNLVRKGMLSCSDERSGSGNSQPSTSSHTAQVPVRAVRKETESSNQASTILAVGFVSCMAAAVLFLTWLSCRLKTMEKSPKDEESSSSDSISDSSSGGSSTGESSTSGKLSWDHSYEEIKTISHLQELAVPYDANYIAVPLRSSSILV